LRKHGGFIPATDKSSPDEIRQRFAISKKMYKKAIGALYRKKVIQIEPEGIRLLESQAPRSK